MANRLFIAQQQLETWLDQDKVCFEGNVLTLLADGASYVLEPAVRVVSLLGGEDTHGLLGRTLGLADLGTRGVEHYRDSLIVGDAAYQCEEGFVGTAVPPSPAARPGSASAAAPRPVVTAAPSGATAASAAGPVPARRGAPVAANPARFKVPPPPPPAPATGPAAASPRPSFAPAGSTEAKRPATPPGASTGAATPDPAAAAEQQPVAASDFDMLAEFMLKHM